MLTKIIILVVLILAVGGVFMLVKSTKPVTPQQTQQQQPPSPTAAAVVTKQSTLLDYGDQELAIELTQVKVKTSATASGQFDAKMTNRVVTSSGNRAAAIIVDSPGDTGPYYYVVGGMLKDGKRIASAPQSLGDKIKVVSVSVDDPGAHDNGLITVEILNRAPNSPEPTIKMTKKYAFQENGNLIEVLH